MELEKLKVLLSTLVLSASIFFCPTPVDAKGCSYGGFSSPRACQQQVDKWLYEELKRCESAANHIYAGVCKHGVRSKEPERRAQCQGKCPGGGYCIDGLCCPAQNSKRCGEECMDECGICYRDTIKPIKLEACVKCVNAEITDLSGAVINYQVLTECGGNGVKCCGWKGCKNIESDKQNCGGCGNVCPGNKVCSGGQCVCQIGGCGPSCTVCPSNQTCLNDQCVVTGCPSNTTYCGDHPSPAFGDVCCSNAPNKFCDKDSAGNPMCCTRSADGNVSCGFTP